MIIDRLACRRLRIAVGVALVGAGDMRADGDPRSCPPRPRLAASADQGCERESPCGRAERHFSAPCQPVAPYVHHRARHLGMRELQEKWLLLGLRQFGYRMRLRHRNLGLLLDGR